MKGYIFDTPFYTKRDWHTGKMILSRNGQVPGFPTGDGNLAGQVRFSFMEAAHSASSDPNFRRKVSYRGKRMIQGNLIIGSKLAGHSHGGAQKKAQESQLKKQITAQKLSAGLGRISQASERMSMGMPSNFESYGF